MEALVLCGRSSVVERLLAKEKATSSNLVARSGKVGRLYACRFLLLATWPSGKAEVCKTFITGSNPVVAFTIVFEALARVQGLFVFAQRMTDEFPNNS